mmetsp:Transcript_3466/g.4828  ORF Transcript_3466/g.4828 Transcript_3466/m.4828 type:complete len:130 (+) Transcript_3466:132-521(+)
MWIRNFSHHHTLKRIISMNVCALYLKSHLPSSTLNLNRYIASKTQLNSLAMKPGTPIPGLDFMKDKEKAPVVLERSEYPQWVSELAKPLTTLGKLKKMDIKDATDDDQKRYLKLTRRLEIKEHNIEASL